jgi:hypothetical protein
MQDHTAQLTGMRDAGTPGHDDGRGRVVAQLEVALPSLAGRWPGNRLRCA